MIKGGKSNCGSIKNKSQAQVRQMAKIPGLAGERARLAMKSARILSPK